MNPLLPKPQPLLIVLIVALAFGSVVRCYRHAGKVPSAQKTAMGGL